jgi:hypothetical protein
MGERVRDLIADGGLHEVSAYLYRSLELADLTAIQEPTTRYMAALASPDWRIHRYASRAPSRKPVQLSVVTRHLHASSGVRVHT